MRTAPPRGCIVMCMITKRPSGVASSMPTATGCRAQPWESRQSCRCVVLTPLCVCGDPVRSDGRGCMSHDTDSRENRGADIATTTVTEAAGIRSGTVTPDGPTPPAKSSNTVRSSGEARRPPTDTHTHSPCDDEPSAWWHIRGDDTSPADFPAVSGVSLRWSSGGQRKRPLLRVKERPPGATICKRGAYSFRPKDNRCDVPRSPNGTNA